MAALVDVAARGTAAGTLAQHLGAEHLVVFVEDETTGTLLPAPGFPQTLPGGIAWRNLVRQALPGAPARGALLWPGADGPQPALALAGAPGVVVVLLGGRPVPESCDEAMPLLSLLAAVFRAERRAVAFLGAAEVARASSRKAEALAAALVDARDALNKALHELREADRRKDEFIAMMAHELRNPLAAAAHALHVLRGTASDEDTRENALAIVDRQTQTLARLVDDLLDTSRITLGKLELRREPLDLAALVKRAADSASPHVAAAGQALVLDVPQEGPWVEGDAVRLEQVVANFLTNAVRYGGSGATVKVSLREESGRALLSVEDDGAGIPPELLARLFDPFSQGTQGLARTAGGLGIGLALVHTLVTLHGGTVDARSGGVGHGSVFTVELPITARRAPVTVESPPLTVERAPEARGAARRILVVDDNVDSAEMLAVVLEQWGHEISLAHDGESALDVARSFLPDLVLLDIGLPGLSGYGVAQRLSQAEGARPLLVALTGYGQPEDVARAEAAGFDLHLLKPVDFGRLQAVLATPPRA